VITTADRRHRAVALLVAMNGRGHVHDGHADPAHSHVTRSTQRRALWISLVANGVFMVVEFFGGLVFQSLALIADAAHMLSDVAGLSVALVAQHLVDRRATARHSYGLQRAEVLGAQANGLALLVVAAWVIYEAVRRIGDPADVAGGGLLVVATIGLVVNVVSAVLLARAQGRSLNMRGAFVHMTMDAAGSVAAMVAGISVVVWNADWVDPVASILIAVLVLWSAWGLLRDTAHVLLEGTPRGLDPASVEATLAADDEVEAVHHLHLWNLASDVPAMSAHVVLRGEVSLHDAQTSGDRLKALLERRFGITHTTLELECHPCDPAPDEHTRSGDGHPR
jgi:cobalt-zinc-cadmium efflux system protein